MITQKKLLQIFNERLRYSSATGIDRVRPEKFENNLKSEIKLICYQIQTGKFKFRPYKELLISKGRDKFPRVVSIPTVRDKLVLTWILNELQELNPVSHDFVYEVIRKVRDSASAGYTHYIKIDIAGFYDNIDHQLLLSDLKARIKKQKKIILLVMDAIQTPTTPLNKKPSQRNNIGVPQGIPISNYLAQCFGQRLDSAFENKSYIYIRYVDDIVILGRSAKELEHAKSIIQDRITSSGLTFNKEKSIDGVFAMGLDFLGYHFMSNGQRTILSIRKSSYERHYLSLLKVFSSFAHKRQKNLNPSDERLAWDLNLKIVGAILDNERYGWLYFFSQVDLDSPQIYKLDNFVDEQLKKLNLDRAALKIKRYSRALHEIQKNLSGSKYLINLDKYELKDKKQFLIKFGNKSDQEINLMDEYQIENEFKKSVYKDLRALEKDMGSNS